MLRHLVLVRHAKSSWGDSSLSDHDRPLAPRGVKALPRITDHLARAAARPELVLCSTARRTVDTLAGIRSALPADMRIETVRALYGASVDTVLGLLHGVAVDVGCVMIIGHNPTLQDVAITLVGEGDAALRASVAAKLPTGAAVTLSFDIAWSDLGPGTARLDDVFMPRPPRL